MESIPRFIACKHNPKLVSYKHPALEPILSLGIVELEPRGLIGYHGVADRMGFIEGVIGKIVNFIVNR